MSSERVYSEKEVREILDLAREFEMYAQKVNAVSFVDKHILEKGRNLLAKLKNYETVLDHQIKQVDGVVNDPKVISDSEKYHITDFE